MSRDEATLVQILAAARRAVAFLADADLPTFQGDEKAQSAVLQDILIHEYDTVDVEEVRRTVSRDLPELIRDLEAPRPPAS
jgi:uncharacterized protein with HEPN domain